MELYFLILLFILMMGALGFGFPVAIDASKIKQTLGWEPKTSFELGLEKTVKYYLNKQ